MWYPALVEPREGAPKGHPMARGRSLTEFQKEFPDEAAQSVIRAQSPSLHQGEDPMNPGQHDVRGHLANHARIVPVAGQSWIRGMAVRQQRRTGFYVGSYESLDRGRRVVGDH